MANSKETYPCDFYTFICQKGDNIFDVMTRLARKVESAESMIRHLSTKFPGRSSIIGMYKRIEAQHQLSLEVDEEEALEYLRVLDAAESAEEALVYGYALLLALDQAVQPHIQAYWSCIADQDGVLNSATRHLGYLVPKKPGNPYARGPKPVDVVDRVSATSCLKSVSFVPASPHGYDLELRRVDDLCWSAMARVSDEDISVGARAF